MLLCFNVCRSASMRGMKGQFLNGSDLLLYFKVGLFAALSSPSTPLTKAFFSHLFFFETE
jgi:hypothetical protein